MSTEDRRKTITKNFPKRDYARLEGAGVRQKALRLLSYKEKYVLHCLMRLRILPKRDVVAKTFWGKEIVLPLWDSDALSLCAFGILGGNEYKLAQFFLKNLKDEDVFYDIGANYGFYSALALEIARKGEVHVFEPSPSVFPYLKRSCENEERCFLQNVAISDQNGSTSFFDSSSAHRSGHSTLMQAVATQRPGEYKTERVRSITLDIYAKEHRKPTIMKIDVEGAEGLVIRGGLSVIENSKPVITLEVWSGVLSQGNTQQEALRFLQELGYKAFRLLEDGEVESIQITRLYRNVPTSINGDNFIFTR